MESIAIGYPNRSDGGVFSGGDWQMPLINVQNRDLSLVARSADLDPASCTMLIDLKGRRSLRTFAIAGHNMTIGASYRVFASTTADYSDIVFDRTYSVYRDLATEDWDYRAQKFEDFNFWLGSVSEEDLAGRTRISMRLLTEEVSAGYWGITILDRANPAGYIDIGRIYIGELFLQPDINANWGVGNSFEDPTNVDETWGGVEYFDGREPKPVMRFTFANLSDKEGAKALELTRRAGISDELLVFGDPQTTTFGSSNRNFLGRMRTLNALEQLSMQTNSMAFELKGL